MLAARQVVFLARDKGIKHVSIEGDCLTVIRALKSYDLAFSNGCFLDNIKRCMPLFDYYFL